MSQRTKKIQAMNGQFQCEEMLRMTALQTDCSTTRYARCQEW